MFWIKYVWKMNVELFRNVFQMIVNKYVQDTNCKLLTNGLRIDMYKAYA